MAIGDSLASVIMERNGISNEEFALNHPSGFLGKKLTLLVSDIMIPIKKFKYLNPESKFQDIIEIITGGKIGCGLVINNEKLELEGIITDGDIRRALKDKSPKDWGEINATDLMTKNPITIDHKVLAFEAIKTMENNNKNKLISTLPVINQKGNKKHVIGILQMHDIVQAGLR